MIQEGRLLYATLEKNTASLNASKDPPIVITERSFAAANEYWRLLKVRLKDYVFESESAEIYFFKQVKPLFTSSIEYYGLLAHAQLFLVNSPDLRELDRFFCREMKRLNKYTIANQDFFDYSQSGKTDRDANLFVRSNNDGANFLHAKPYDLDSFATTRGDYLISSWMALTRYQVYLSAISRSYMRPD